MSYAEFHSTIEKKILNNECFNINKDSITTKYIIKVAKSEYININVDSLFKTLLIDSKYYNEDYPYHSRQVMIYFLALFEHDYLIYHGGADDIYSFVKYTGYYSPRTKHRKN